MADFIDFYFDFSSPYGYLASTQIDNLAADLGRTVNWCPILLGPMFKATGSAPLADIPLKREYGLHDFARSADLFDIPYQQPSDFPIGTVTAARVTVWLRGHDMALAGKFAKRIYADYFASGLDIREPTVIHAAASDLGISISDLDVAVNDQAIKDQLKADVAAAMERGVFGSPFIFVDNEPFWGFDRLAYIRLWAQKHNI